MNKGNWCNGIYGKLCLLKWKKKKRQAWAKIQRGASDGEILEYAEMRLMNGKRSFMVL